MWIESESTLKVEQREFGPQLRAPPFVATRKNAILVPNYYAAKKKVSSSLSADRDPGQFSDSGRGRMPEQLQSVTADRDESIDDEINSSLIHNKRDENKKDTVVKVILNEGITRELKTTNVTETDMEENNEELSLAKEFEAATLQGLGKKSTKNPSSRATLSYSPKIKKACDTQVARTLHTDSTRSAPTWKRKERSNTGDKVETSKSLGNKKNQQI